jgi:hypothetical protein
MTILADLAGMLAFRAQSLRAQAEKRMYWSGTACFSAGSLAYALVRNHVYAALPEIAAQPPGAAVYMLLVDLVRTLFFLSAVYVPWLLLLSRAIAGRGRILAISGEEYTRHVSALFPLWGMLFLLAAPVQWFIPHFLVAGMFEVSVGMAARSLAIGVYTVWAVQRLGGLTAAQATSVFILSWFALLLFFLMVYTYYALLLLMAVSFVWLVSRLLRK